MKGMVHIVFLLNIPESCGWGGCEEHLMDFFRRVDYGRAKVTLGTNRDLFRERLAAENLPVHVRRFDFHPEESGLANFFAMRRFLSSLSADKVIFMLNGFLQFLWPSTLAAWLVTRGQVFSLDVLGAPLLEKETGRRYWGGVRGMGLWWYKQVAGIRLRAVLTRRILAISKDVKERMVRCYGYPPGKIFIRHHGTDCSRFRPDRTIREEVRGELAVGDAEKVIITVARLSRQKRLDRLIEAFAGVPSSDGGPLLLIVGDGEEKDVLTRMARTYPDAAERIRFLGHRADVSRLLQAADIFVLSSDNEGFPRSVMEALACGLVVVTTDVPGVDRVIQEGQTGFLVEKSVEAVRRGLVRALALDETERERMSASSVALIKDNFGLEQAVRESFALLEVPYRTGQEDNK